MGHSMVKWDEPGELEFRKLALGSAGNPCAFPFVKGWFLLLRIARHEAHGHGRACGSFFLSFTLTPGTSCPRGAYRRVGKQETSRAKK